MSDKEKKMKIIWQILDCKKIERRYRGFEVTSPMISIPFGDLTTEWNLVFFPAGGYEDPKENLISVSLDSSTFNCDFDFNIGFLNNSNGQVFMVKKSKFSRNTSLSHRHLFDPTRHFIKDDTITIVCELTIKPKEKFKKSQVLSSSDFSKMFEDEYFHDFVLEMSDGKELKAHKFVLVTRSPVFFAMLKNDTQEAKESKVKIVDFETITMKEFLRYLYCNEVEGLENIASDLVFAAEKYEIEGLKKICLESIISSMSTDNVVKILKIADRVSGTENLFNKCLDEIVANFQIVSSSSEWKEISKELLTKVTNEALKRLAEKGWDSIYVYTKKFIIESPLHPVGDSESTDSISSDEN